MKIGGNCSYRPLGAFQTVQDPNKPQEKQIFRDHFFEEKPDTMIDYSKTLNNRTGGPNNEYRGGPGGPGSSFCSSGGGFFSLSSRSGLPLRLLPLKPPPGLQKPVPGPPGPPLYSLLAPPVRLLDVLE